MVVPELELLEVLLEELEELELLDVLEVVLPPPVVTLILETV